jgi:hypothetical protein
VRTEMLKKAGFTSEQVRILMEQGLCGNINLENKSKYNTYIQKIFDNKFKLDNVQIPIKNSKCEFHFFENN